MEPQSNKYTLNVRIPKDAYALVKKLGEKQDRPMSRIIRSAVFEYYEKNVDTRSKK